MKLRAKLLGAVLLGVLCAPASGANLPPLVLSSGQIQQAQSGDTVQLPNVTGSTQCIHASTTGALSGTGSDCGSGGGGDFTQLGNVTTSGSAASVTFSSISGSYTNLMIVASMRGDTSATNVVLDIQFNGDTGANYDWIAENRYGATGANGTSTPRIGNINAATDPASYPAAFYLFIPNYAGTTFYKAAEASDTLMSGALSTANMLSEQTTTWWRNTAAITSIKLFPAAGNFANGSQITLYGMK